MTEGAPQGRPKSTRLFYAKRVPETRRGGDRLRVSAPASLDEGLTRAFTADQVRSLTGLSKRQIQYWDERGFYRPSLTARKGRGRRRLYDFRDLVALRTAAQLRVDHISLQLIRKVDAYLRGLDYEKPMAELKFEVSGGDLYFEESDSVRHARRPEQTVIRVTVPVGRLVEALKADIAKLDRRPLGVLERRRRTLGGKLLIAGTRIPVGIVQRLHADGASVNAILEMFPDLRRRDVTVALKAPPEDERRRGHAEAS
jgi:uncharacterized protein (DUF433 family)